MASGLQDLLKIIDMGYEAEQRREDRQVQTTLALLESSARRKQATAEMALKSERFALEKSAKMLEVAQSANDMAMTKQANFVFSTLGGGSFDPAETDSKTGVGYYKDLLKDSGFKDGRKLDAYGTKIYNTIIGYSSQPEAYRDQILGLGEEILEMRYTDIGEDGAYKSGSTLSKFNAMGALNEDVFSTLEGIPVSRANERDISREVLEFTTGDYEIQSPIGIRSYDDILADRIAGQFEEEDVFNSLNQLELASLLEMFGNNPDEAKRLSALHRNEGVLEVLSSERLGAQTYKSITEGKKYVDPNTGRVFVMVSAPQNRQEGKYLIRDVSNDKQFHVPSYVAAKLKPQ